MNKFHTAGLDNEPFVRYGDFVLILGTCVTDIQQKLDGALSGTGFTDNRLFFQSLPFNLADQSVLENPASISLIRNYRDFIFQVWPRLNYDANKEFRNFRRDRSKYANMRHIKNDRDESLLQDYEFNLSKLEERAKRERETNKNALKRFMGLPIRFGAEFQLMHADSSLFLMGKVQASESQLSAFKFELSDQFSSGMIFQILPKYRAHSDGSRIQYDEDLFIKNVKLDCYLNFCWDFPIALDVPVQTNTQIKYPVSPYQQAELRKLDPTSIRYQAHLSDREEAFWKFQFFRRPVMRKDEDDQSIDEKIAERIIRGGDLIRLGQSEGSNYIAADLRYQGASHNQVYAYSYQGAFGVEKTAVNQIWEVEKICAVGRGIEIKTQSYSWNYKSENTDTPQFKLRHFLTGRVMALIEVNLNGKNTLIPALANENDDKLIQGPESSIIFLPTIFQKQLDVYDGSSYGLYFSKQDTFVATSDEVVYTIRGQGSKENLINEDLDTPSDSTTDLNRIEEASVSNFYKPLKESELGVKRTAMYLDARVSTQHSFFVHRISDEEKRDLLFVSSTIHRLHHLQERIKMQQTSSLTPDYLKRTISVLGQLVLFVMGTSPEADVDPLKHEAFTIPSRQKLLKDMFFLEMLTNILHYAFSTGQYNFIRICDPLMLRIFQLSYKLIRLVIFENRPIEIYASQWLDLFVSHTLLSGPESNILAEPTLIEMIDNNKKILETRINKDIINKFMTNLRTSGPDKKFLKLLRVLTVCDGEPMISNQIEITKLLFQDESCRVRIYYRLERRRNGEIYILVPHYQNWVRLKYLHKESKKPDGNSNTYEYFLSVLELMADLCLSRNLLAIEELVDMYPRDLVYAVTSSAEYNVELRTAFSKLFMTLWVDRAYERLQLPSYLYTWDEITPSNCEDLHKYNDVNEDLDNFKVFLQKYLEEVSHLKYLRAYELESNLLTLSLLDNLKFMLELGYYSSIFTIENILKPLLKILNGVNDVTTEIEEMKKKSKHSFTMVDIDSIQYKESVQDSRYKTTPNNLVVMKIKMKILQILKIITNYFMDFRIRRILLELKKDSDPQIKMRQSQKNEVQNTTLIGAVQDIFYDKKLRLDYYTNVPFNTILLDLLLYQNYDLQKLTFETIYEQHTQHANLKEMFQMLHFVDDKTAMKNIDTIKQLGAKVREYCESTEMWYNNPSEAAIDKSIKVAATILRLAQFLILDEVVELLKNTEPEEEGYILESDLTEDVVDMNTEPDSENQKIIRYLNTYKPIAEILEYDLQTRSTRNKKRLPSANKVLRACVLFLARFVKGEKKNQRLVAKYMEILMKHLKKDPSLGLETVISELFNDNKILLNDYGAIKNYIDAVVRLIEDLPNTDLNRGKLVLTFKSLMKYYTKVIKHNQTLVLEALLDRECETLFIDFSKPQAMEIITRDLVAYEHQLREKISPVCLSGEIDYLCCLLEVLSVSTESKNATTESKCQSLFSIDILNKIYSYSNKCYHLKYSVAEFFYNTYIDTERDLIQSVHEFSEMIQMMAEDLRNILLEGNETYEVKNHARTVPVKNVQEKLVFEGLLPIMIVLMTKPQIYHVPMFSKPIVMAAKSYQIFLEGLSDPEQISSIKSFLNLVQRHLSNELDQIKLEVDELTYKSSDWKQNVYSPRKHKGNFDATKSLLKTKKYGNSKANKLIQKLSFLETQEYSDCIEAEFEMLLQRIVTNQKYQQEREEEEIVIPFEKIIEALIELISKDEIGSELRSMGLKVFRKIIEREVPVKESAIEWRISDWSPYRSGIEERQGMLANLGVVDLVHKIFSSSQSTRVQQECLSLIIALLIGGNQTTQGTFLACMVEDPQNEFLCRIRKNIIKEMEDVKKSMQKINEEFSKNPDDEDPDENKLTASFYPVQKHQSGILRRATMLIPTFLRTELNQTATANPNVLGGVDKQTNQLFKEDQESVRYLVQHMKILQLFCEGHYIDMQHHLRGQRNLNGSLNIKSFDFISNTTAWLGTAIRYLNVICIDFIIQMLDFLIESAQGPCTENQSTLVSSRIIPICMKFSTTFSKKSDQKLRGFRNEEQLNRLNESITKAIKLLYTLQEGNHDKKILEELSNGLNFDFLMSKLALELDGICDRNSISKNESVATINEIFKLKDDPFDRWMLEAFNIFILIKTLVENSKKVEKLMHKGLNQKGFTPHQCKAYNFFESNVASIEIIFNKKLMKVFFPVLPPARFFPQSTKVRWMSNVCRDSHNQKLMSLMHSSDDLIDEFEHLSKLNRWWFPLTLQRYQQFKNYSLGIVFLICLLVLFTYVRDFDDTLQYRNSYLVTNYIEIFGGTTHPALSIKSIIRFLSSLQILVAFGIMASKFILLAPILLRQKWRQINYEAQHLQSLKNENDKVDEESEGEEEQDDENSDEQLQRRVKRDEQQNFDLSSLSATKTLELLYRYGPYSPIFNQNGKKSFGNLYTTFVYMFTNIRILLKDSAIRFVLFYFIISLLGLLSTEIVYSLLLLDIISRSSKLQTIVQTINVNMDSFLSTAMLWLIMIYIFTLFGMWYLDDLFVIEKVGPEGERVCSNMFQCFLVTTDFGTRVDAGIGEYLKVPSYAPSTRTRWYVKIVWEFLYYIIINYMILEAVFAIIVEGFAVLRKRKEIMEDDMYNICFICDIGKEYFDKYSTGFFKHFLIHHNAWNYTFFLYLMKKKDRSEFNGFESYISNCVATEDLSWIPNLRSLELERVPGLKVHKRKKKIEE